MNQRQDLLSELMQNFALFKKGIMKNMSDSKIDLHAGQREVMFAIASHNGLGLKELATMLSITSGAATQHVDSLVSAGLVVRSIDPNDRRAVTIELSKKGQSLIKRMYKLRNAAMEDALSTLSESELKTFVELFQKINSN